MKQTIYDVIAAIMREAGPLELADLIRKQTTSVCVLLPRDKK